MAHSTRQFRPRVIALLEQGWKADDIAAHFRGQVGRTTVWQWRKEWQQSKRTPKDQAQAS